VTGRKEESMKYICFGYLEPGKFENMTDSERNIVLDECFATTTNCARTAIWSLRSLCSLRARR
jgi:hypothetical protein